MSWPAMAQHAVGILDSWLASAWSAVLTWRWTLSQPWFDGLFFLSVYVLYSAVFLVADHTGCLDRWRLQPRVSAVRDANSRYAANVAYVFACTVLPINVLVALLAPVRVLPEEPPTAATFARELAILVFTMDTGYFFGHWLMHSDPWLYRTFHQIHHEATATNAWVANHLTISEFLFVAVLQVVPPFLIGAHPLSAWVWNVISVIMSVDDHCGYDIPFGPFALCSRAGIVGGARHHDLHHLRPTKGNYAPYFTFWDRLCGTHFDGRSLTRDQFLHGEADSKRSKAD